MKSTTLLFLSTLTLHAADNLAKADKPSLLPASWDPALAGDIVMQRLIRVTAPQVKGAHDAEFVCVGERAYIVEHDNDVAPGHGAGAAMYCVLTVVNLKTLKVEKTHLLAKDGQLWRSISRDKGETWSAAEKTGLTATSSASHLLCTRKGTLVLTYNPGPVPLRFPLLLRTSQDEGLTWSEPTLLADRPQKVGGWSTCYPSLTELPDGTLVALWAQIKGSTGELYGDIHSARIVFKK
jgi:hypothetical protein